MIIAIATIFDDIYDSYATPEECELFTKCIESWDGKAAYELPECMKFALGKILDSFQTIANMLNQEEKYRMSYLRYFKHIRKRGRGGRWRAPFSCRHRCSHLRSGKLIRGLLRHYKTAPPLSPTGSSAVEPAPPARARARRERNRYKDVVGPVEARHTDRLDDRR
nr:unnamed protein product [Digitaria exilis]